MHLQAIQTQYKGFRFRSRLEARWAVFLDALDAKWSYEKEGFDLAGNWYLPDFWVHDWDTWIEIKATRPSAEELSKCDLLAKASGKNVLLLAGEPWLKDDKNEYDITLFGREQGDWNGTSGWEFGEGRRCASEIWLVSDDHGAFALRPVAHEGDHKYPLSGNFADSILAALAAARAARFEHGEQGGPSPSNT